MKTKTKKTKELKLSLDSNLKSMREFNTHFNNHLSDKYNDVILKGLSLIGAVVALVILVI